MKDATERAIIMQIFKSSTQLTFTCSNSNIETLKNEWNMFKVNNENTSRHWLRSGVFTVNFDVLVFLLLTLNIFQSFFSVSIVCWNNINSVKWSALEHLFCLIWTTKFFIFNIQKTAYFYDFQLVVKFKALKTTKNYKSWK